MAPWCALAKQARPFSRHHQGSRFTQGGRTALIDRCTGQYSVHPVKTSHCRAVPEDDLGEDLSDFMKQDLERFTAKQQQQQQQQGSTLQSSNQDQQGSGSSSLKEGVDKVLIADFFFILVVLAWLGAGLAEKGVLHSSMLIDAWMPLWPMVFQPAIGILMAGALVSGGLNWLQEQQQKQ